MRNWPTSTHIEFGDYTVLNQGSRTIRQVNFGDSAQGYGKAEQNEVTTKVGQQGS